VFCHQTPKIDALKNKIIYSTHYVVRVQVLTELSVRSLSSLTPPWSDPRNKKLDLFHNFTLIQGTWQSIVDTLGSGLLRVLCKRSRYSQGGDNWSSPVSGSEGEHLLPKR
jgi:hypothetical protein